MAANSHDAFHVMQPLIGHSLLSSMILLLSFGVLSPKASHSHGGWEPVQPVISENLHLQGPLSLVLGATLFSLSLMSMVTALTPAVSPSLLELRSIVRLGRLCSRFIQRISPFLVHEFSEGIIKAPLNTLWPLFSPLLPGP
jgi:hypothetical protein